MHQGLAARRMRSQLARRWGGGGKKRGQTAAIRPTPLPQAPGAGGERRSTWGEWGLGARWPRRASLAATPSRKWLRPALARPRLGAPPPRSLAEQPGQEAFEPERLERDLMAALALGGPGDAASAALDELSRNFTYGALGAGNGSLSGAWYRRNQVRAVRPAARWGQAQGRGASCSSAALLPSLRKTPGGPSGTN